MSLPEKSEDIFVSKESEEEARQRVEKNLEEIRLTNNSIERFSIELKSKLDDINKLWIFRRPLESSNYSNYIVKIEALDEKNNHNIYNDLNELKSIAINEKNSASANKDFYLFLKLSDLIRNINVSLEYFEKDKNWNWTWIDEKNSEFKKDWKFSNIELEELHSLAINEKDLMYDKNKEKALDLLILIINEFKAMNKWEINISDFEKKLNILKINNNNNEISKHIDKFLTDYKINNNLENLNKKF